LPRAANRRRGYAIFAVAEPPLKLVLIEGTPRKATRMDQLGVELAFRGRPARLIGAPVWHTSFV
jgi:hypothetical protein